jgi:hypothetical protein
MTVSGQRLSSKVGVTWEFAGYAVGILFIVAGVGLRLAKRIDELEQAVTGLRKG